MSRVWIPNLGALPIIASVSLTHLPCLFACFYESVSCVYAVFSTYLSTCVVRAACFVFGSLFITTSLFSLFSLCKFNRHLCHGAYWCTHNPDLIPILLFHLHLPFPPSFCVPEQVYAWSSSSIFTNVSPCSYVYVCRLFVMTIFLFSFFFFYTFKRHLCHGAYWCTHNPAHMPRLLPIYIFISHLPPTSRACIQIYIHISIHTPAPFIRTSCSLMCSLTCKLLRTNI